MSRPTPWMSIWESASLQQMPSHEKVLESVYGKSQGWVSSQSQYDTGHGGQSSHGGHAGHPGPPAAGIAAVRGSRAA